jgi:cell division septation protein DedD
MDDAQAAQAAQAARAVQAALRCYPARWRRRHGDEAAELATLLIRDGAPPRSIALSYLAGATRAWLTLRPVRRLSAAACALLAATCLLGVSAGLLASAWPARAASTSQPSTSQPSTSQPGTSQPGTSQPGTSQPWQSQSQATKASPRPHCEPVPGVIGATSHPQMIIQAATHDRSC